LELTVVLELLELPELPALPVLAVLTPVSALTGLSALLLTPLPALLAQPMNDRIKIIAIQVKIEAAKLGRQKQHFIILYYNYTQNEPKKPPLPYDLCTFTQNGMGIFI